MKKNKILSIFVLFLVIVVVFSGCGGQNNHKKTVSASDVSNGMLDITIDGQIYTFPYDYTKLQKAGWSFNLSDYDYGKTSHTLNPGERKDMWSEFGPELRNSKYGSNDDSIYFTVGFKNYSNSNKDITDCNINEIIIARFINNKKLAEKFPDIKFYNNIRFGSSKDDVEKAFGELTYIQRFDADTLGHIGHTTYTYHPYVDGLSIYEIGFSFYDDYGLGQIHIRGDCDT